MNKVKKQLSFQLGVNRIGGKGLKILFIEKTFADILAVAHCVVSIMDKLCYKLAKCMCARVCVCVSGRTFINHFYPYCDQKREIAVILPCMTADYNVEIHNHRVDETTQKTLIDL